MTAKQVLSCLMLGISITSCATARVKKKATTMVIEAYNKKIADGAQTSPPQTGDHFIIKWNEATAPETFFWRGQGGWLNCKTEIVHKTSKSGGYKAGSDNIGQVSKGDTLMLSPVTGGRFPIPQEIPTTAKNTIFYKTNGSAWLTLPVKKIVKK